MRPLGRAFLGPCWALLVLLACAKDPPEGGDDGDDTSLGEDTQVVETAVPWPTDAGGDPPLIDTFPLTDDPIGPTAIDGVYEGTFTLRVWTGVPPEAICRGTLTATVDGDADRHVIADFECPTWTRGPSLGPAYGPLVGVGFATLDPDDLASFRMDLTFTARSLDRTNLENLRVTVADGGLTASREDTVGFGDFKVGPGLTLDATVTP